VIDETDPRGNKEHLYTNVKVMVVALDAMLVMIGFGIISPSMSFYLIALEGGLEQPPGPGYVVPPEVVAQFSAVLGVMMASFMATRTLLARYWGGVSDKRGRKPIIMMGLMGYFLLLITFGLAQNWIQMLVIRAFQGVVSAMVWPVAEATVLDIVGAARRAEALGLYTTISNAGFIIGPGVGGALYNICRDVLLLPVPDVFRVPYFIAAIITLPAVPMTAMVLTETCPAKLEALASRTLNVDNIGPSPVELAQHSTILSASSRTAMRVLYVMALMDGFAMGMGQPVFQLFLMSRITTDIGLIGLLISGAGAVGLLFSVPAGRYADKHGRKAVAVAGSLGSRATLFVLPLTIDLSQTTAIWMSQGAMMSISQPALKAIQGDIVPWSLRGRLFGTIQAFFNAGATIGPLIGGALYGMFSLTVFQLGWLSIGGHVLPFWLASGLGLVGAFLLWAFIHETRFSGAASNQGEESKSART